MHYLNDPLCFSQSGGCRRLINLTCLLFPVRSDTHCIFKTCIKTPTLFSRSLFLFAAPIKTNSLFINHQIIIQIDEIVIYANEQNMGAMICLHNECGLCLTVIRFTTAYICTIVDGHEDVMMIFLTDLHALLIFSGGHLVLTLIRGL